MLLGYLWLNKTGTRSAITISGFCSDTITSFFNEFRELAADSLTEIEVVIGGEGIIVQIDECKLGKRKYNRGHAVDGAWILGGVKDTPEKKNFFSLYLIEK